MGLFDDMLKAGMSAMGGSQQQGGIAQGILEMLSGGQGGGLSGLVQTFTQKGMGDIVSSWVSKGPNLPISAEQIQSVLGSDLLSGLAAKAGIAPEMAGSALSQLLPELVDKLTPDGKIPEGGMGSLLEQGMNLFKGKLF